MVDKESHFMLICSIKKKVQEWHLYDCYGKDLGALQNDKRFSRAMNIRYRGKRNVNAGNESCVWILIGKNETEEVCLQVGRTKNLTNLLSSDVKEDIKEICKGDNNSNYGKLKDKYTELSFYEVDIEKYLKNDTDIENIFVEKPVNKYLYLAYAYNRAAYVEGKLSLEKEAVMYHPSSLDGYYREYFKEKSKYSQL